MDIHHDEEKKNLLPPPSPKTLKEKFLLFGDTLKANWAIIFLALHLVLLTAAQTISLPLWVHSFQAISDDFSGTSKSQLIFKIPQGPYIILFYVSAFALVGFAILCVLYYYLGGRPSSLTLSENWGLLVATGLALACNGLFLVYASPPDRTPGENKFFLSF